MPAAYAHHRFGEACIKMMPEKLQKICLDHREVYDFGVHGPDILFYYNPLTTNEVNRYGVVMHQHSGRDFFEKAKESLHMYSDKYEMLAYDLGFLAHFLLDSSCHGYINEMAETSGISHNEIESQYEVFLMRLDGVDPMAYDRSCTLHPGKKTAKVISHVLPFTAKKVNKTLKGQRNTLHLFYSPRQIKKILIRKLIRIFHISGDFGDLFLDEEELPACISMNQEIQHMYEEALVLYPALMKNLIGFLQDKNDLDAYFEHDFEGN